MTLGFQSEATLSFCVQTLTGPRSEVLIGTLSLYFKQSQTGEEGGVGGWVVGYHWD